MYMVIIRHVDPSLQLMPCPIVPGRRRYMPLAGAALESLTREGVNCIQAYNTHQNDDITRLRYDHGNAI